MPPIDLRHVIEDDLSTFFQQQLNPEANQRAAFAAVNPADKNAFGRKWDKILGDETITKRTILFDGDVAGSIVAFVAPWSGKLEVSYWLGREYWGLGIATSALRQFLASLKTRPLYARAAKDNVASIRVLEKCGFKITGHSTGFAAERGGDIEEVTLELSVHPESLLQIDQVRNLSAQDREEVSALTRAVYPPEQLAQWPGRSLQWSTPEWCVRIRDKNESLVSYIGVFVREATCDSRPVTIGGIGNVKTHPAARGQGLAGFGIRRAVEFLHEQSHAQFALLVCEAGLLEYYSRLGWHEFSGRLLVRQYGEHCVFTFNRVLTLGIRVGEVRAHMIDLCGPPW
jgi:RimJ/RimL family protein N-acetyltransferase/GNAT superfamily N-acetyltransferase